MILLLNGNLETDKIKKIKNEREQFKNLLSKQGRETDTRTTRLLGELGIGKEKAYLINKVRL